MFEMKYNSDYMHYLTLEAPREALKHSHTQINASWFHAIWIYIVKGFEWYVSLFHTSNLFWWALALFISLLLLSCALFCIIHIYFLVLGLCGAKLFGGSKYNIYQYIYVFFKRVKHTTGSYIGFISVSQDKFLTKEDVESFFGLDSYKGKIGFQRALGMLSLALLHPFRLIFLIAISLCVSTLVVALYIVILDLLGYIPFSTLVQVGVVLTAIVSLYVYTKNNPKWYPLIILACAVYSIILLVYEPDFYFSTFSKARYYFHPEQAKEAVNIWAYVMVFIFYVSSLELLRIFISMTYFSWARKRFMRKHPNLYTGVENNEVKNNAPDLPITTGELSTNATS
ncbi:MAG: hypothetical protein O2809_04165 [Proteobacteria bacterium]|nr:hypothetical protein [Pseudomonadota bacterium]